MAPGAKAPGERGPSEQDAPETGGQLGVFGAETGEGTKRPGYVAMGRLRSEQAALENVGIELWHLICEPASVMQGASRATGERV